MTRIAAVTVSWICSQLMWQETHTGEGRSDSNSLLLLAVTPLCTAIMRRGTIGGHVTNNIPCPSKRLVAYSEPAGLACPDDVKLMYMYGREGDRSVLQQQAKGDMTPVSISEVTAKRTTSWSGCRRRPTTLCHVNLSERERKAEGRTAYCEVSKGLSCPVHLTTTLKELIFLSP
ncbi:hypothetical protein Q8A73_001106 [Channa argus]|nr:hypothetical protein Q8A73_001106 [Channa argus]